MGVVYEYLTFDGTSSRDFEVWISGNGTFDAPERDVESIAIPGRNGDLHIDNERFRNISITYPAFITKDFRHNFDAFKAYMLSKRGYKRLEDSYHPDYYRLASYQNAISPEMAPLNRAGSFDIVFDCDPRRFLKNGEKTINSPLSAPTTTLINPTLYEAKPLLEISGTGSVTINGIQLNITASPTVIDCDIEEAYYGTENRNNNVVLVNGMFPIFVPGTNTILQTVNNLKITPRWWTI